MIAPEPAEMVERQLHAIRAVLESGRLNYLNGGQGKRFERDFAALVGVRYAIACNSGTSALYAALMSLDLPAGFEAITTPATFVSTIHAIQLAGGVPRLVDVETDAPTISSVAVAKAISPQTRVILPVHLFGLPCNMAELQAIARQHSIFIVEDAAQAFGSQWQGQSLGTLGDAGCFSFCYTKTLTLCGEGGMITTNEPAIARRVASLRNVGYDQCWTGNEWKVGAKGTFAGLNLRLTELQAAVGLAELPHIAQEFVRRREFGARILDSLVSLGFVRCGMPEGAAPVWHAVPVWLPPDRFLAGTDVLLREAKARGIPAESSYRTPMNAYPFFADCMKRHGLPEERIEEIFPNFEQQSRRMIVFKIPRTVTWPDWDRHLASLRDILDHS